MMRQLAIRALRPLRRVVTWLTYDGTLHAISTARHTQMLQQMAFLQEKLDVMHLDSLHQKVDGLNQAVGKMLASSEVGGDQNLASEVSRLDGFIVYHFDALRTDLQHGLRTLHAALGNIHAISLHEKFDALRMEVDRIADGSDRVADRIGALLADELDRLDGSILHHVALLRAALVASRSADAASVGQAILETGSKAETTHTRPGQDGPSRYLSGSLKADVVLDQNGA